MNNNLLNQEQLTGPSILPVRQLSPGEKENELIDQVFESWEEDYVIGQAQTDEPSAFDNWLESLERFPAVRLVT